MYLKQIFVIQSVLFLTINALKCSLNYTVDITDGYVTGDIISKEGVDYNRSNYFTDSNGRIQGCICNLRNCIKKCCDDGSSMVNKTCQPSNTSFSLPTTYTVNDVVPPASPFHIIHPNKFCGDRDAYKISSDEYHLQANGDLFLFDEEGQTFVPPDDFCLEKFAESEEVYALICIEEENVQVIYSIGMLISIPFLFATLVVYALLPECNLHGKALMCYVFSLMMAYILLVSIQLHPVQFEETDCVILGLVCWFFFMVSFFWMNVMCIDIWWAFSGYRSFSGSRNAERKRFIIYNIYAWGVPIAFSIIVSVVNHVLSEHATKWYYPDIGNGQCWFKGGLTLLVYFYGPLSLLICFNVCLFISTALKIWKAKQDTAMLRKDDNRKHNNYDNDKQRFNLYLKLLIAMGINWTTEIISWAVEWRLSTTPTEIWYLTDFCNALYGVFIFFVFVFKRNIWKMLQKRYYSFVGKPHLAHSMTHSMNSTRVTSASAHEKSIVESSA